MKTLVSALALAAMVFAGCQNDFSRGVDPRATGDDLILRAHFIGSEQLLKDKSAPALNDVWKLKSSTDLRNHALDRFAGLPFLWLSNALPKGASDQSALFRPLLEDALARESFVEWHTSAFSLATKLPEARARDWDTNLKHAISNWKLGTPAPLNLPGATGWELAKAGTAVRFVRVDDWVTVTVGPGAAGIESNALARVKQFAAKPNGAWLEGDANLAQWKGRFSLLDGFSNLPAAHFSLSNRADFVRTLVQFNFPKPHQWKSEPWQMPTNIIWDPLMDFTVARGISGVLDELPVFSKLGWNPAPSQVCGWGVRDFLPFQVNYAFPARNVSRQLKNIEPKLRAEIARLAGTNFLGFLVLETNQLNLSWRGLPLAAPQVELVKDGNNEFAVVSFFPIAKLKDRPPQELFAQIERHDLVLYDWESTQHRMNTWQQVYQLGEIGTHRMLSPTNALDQRWQTDVMPLLHDCVTELHATSPTQMTLVRKSSVGLSSFELVTLSRWIESTSFPAFGFYPPQHATKFPGKSGAKH